MKISLGFKSRYNNGMLASSMGEPEDQEEQEERVCYPQLSVQQECADKLMAEGAMPDRIIEAKVRFRVTGVSARAERNDEYGSPYGDHSSVELEVMEMSDVKITNAEGSDSTDQSAEDALEGYISERGLRKSKED